MKSWEPPVDSSQTPGFLLLINDGNIYGLMMGKYGLIHVLAVICFDIKKQSWRIPQDQPALRLLFGFGEEKEGASERQVQSGNLGEVDPADKVSSGCEIPLLIDDLTTIYRNLTINNMGILVDIYLIIDG